MRSSAYPRMKLRDRACLCKRRFESKGEAIESIKVGGCRVKLEAYHCKFCGYWHKTRAHRKDVTL